VELLLEEMHRVGQFLEWHARWWIGCADQRECIDKGIQEGLSAYTYCQASIRHQMKENLEKLRKPVSLWVASGEIIGNDDVDCREPEAIDT